MKIIKRGIPPEEVVWKATCHRCKSELEAKRNELQVEWDQREQGELGRADCPVCKNPIIFYPAVENQPKGLR
jgi:hypothetical protein